MHLRTPSNCFATTAIPSLRDAPVVLFSGRRGKRVVFMTRVSALLLRARASRKVNDQDIIAATTQALASLSVAPAVNN